MVGTIRLSLFFTLPSFLLFLWFSSFSYSFSSNSLLKVLFPVLSFAVVLSLLCSLMSLESPLHPLY